MSNPNQQQTGSLTLRQTYTALESSSPNAFPLDLYHQFKHLPPYRRFKISLDETDPQASPIREFCVATVSYRAQDWARQPGGACDQYLYAADKITRIHADVHEMRRNQRYQYSTGRMPFVLCPLSHHRQHTSANIPTAHLIKERLTCISECSARLRRAALRLGQRQAEINAHIERVIECATEAPVVLSTEFQDRISDPTLFYLLDSTLGELLRNRRPAIYVALPDHWIPLTDLHRATATYLRSLHSRLVDLHSFQYAIHNQTDRRELRVCCQDGIRKTLHCSIKLQSKEPEPEGTEVLSKAQSQKQRPAPSNTAVEDYPYMPSDIDIASRVVDTDLDLPTIIIKCPETYLNEPLIKAAIHAAYYRKEDTVEVVKQLLETQLMLEKQPEGTLLDETSLPHRLVLWTEGAAQNAHFSS
ncbi:hypothetical protein GMRT_10183 [Giardia muris]|uniref:Uncharacterized protein n=1 Tax=Giardia muris TaxID=5742 RepID=A0A4Z1T2D0_GIAMU|nr:hypothetical protein GMRT_10183 [Giardia muris]|eukprot:TNJ26749.1 hypothetical protein GMRT_10183 [Giardia muris]